MTEWRPVVGYEGLYEVSDTGRVRSLERRVNSSRWGHTRLVPGRELAFYISRDGYPTFTLHKGGAGKKNIKASRLVARAFLPGVNGKDWVLHNDGDRKNNAVDNLRWGTPKENSEDMASHGTNHYLSRDSCTAGHQYTEENTRYRAKGGSRICLDCEKVYSKTSRTKAKSAEPKKHGTLDGYVSYQCRCAECKTVWSNYQKQRRSTVR